MYHPRSDCVRAGKRSRQHRSVEDGRFEGASPRPGKRRDLAKIVSAKQRPNKADFTGISVPPKTGLSAGERLTARLIVRIL